jgi:uncharacterized membrane protein
MFDAQILFAIAALGAASYALRAGGFLAAGAMPENGLLARLLKKAPGSLFVAFITGACAESGWPGVVGCAFGLMTALATKKEWAGLLAGFGAAAIVALWR